MFSDANDHPARGATKVPPTPAPFVSPEQYLQAERRAETKSEYFAGQIFPMTGASLRHNRIVANLVASLHQQVHGRRCEVYPSDMRLLVGATGLYTYPDVTVVRGEPKLAGEYRDTLLNPTALIEVLSDSTERYDRSRKSEHYRQIDSLDEYLLVHHREPWIELHRRVAQQEWTVAEAHGLGASLELRSVECVLTLADVYNRVF